VRIAIANMLLIEDPSILVIKDAMTRIAGWFVLPAFVIALAWEYFNEFNFVEVVKKLILVLVFIGAFYSIHKEGVELSLKYSDELLKEISPRNVFLRKWSEVKVKTAEDKTSKKTGWGIVESFVVPNLNDLIGTALFLMSKLSIWILKLVYSTVYHLTYIFAPLTAVLYFFPLSKSSISGSILSSFWCMLLPFVLVAILALVGNSMETTASKGEFIFSSMDQILWLFGVTLLIATTPIITLGLLKGGGVAMSGVAAGAVATNSASKFASAIPGASGTVARIGSRAMSLGARGVEHISRGIRKGNREMENKQSSSKENIQVNKDDIRPINESQTPKEQGGSNLSTDKGKYVDPISSQSNSPTTKSLSSQVKTGGKKATEVLGKGLSKIMTIKENSIPKESMRQASISPRQFTNTQKIARESIYPVRQPSVRAVSDINKTPTTDSNKKFDYKVKLDQKKNFKRRDSFRGKDI
jgi:hypothetical protein